MWSRRGVITRNHKGRVACGDVSVRDGRSSQYYPRKRFAYIEAESYSVENEKPSDSARESSVENAGTGWPAAVLTARFVNVAGQAQ
jgi:hypothetical protein